ncbi:hypothetical protein ASPFODRAFT_29373 [Aspergillus luchuensis CBS 106.47]|uniref:Uncharacterized protein n=1 Tax=Aspergillus luchuensis (strain CBS 106.47) TaxID=1137211 RepID=A0A1M3TVQ3_ASPLC|nr:hypothetical protein ASPFODRAFT_29373 [Aspergillus luchuensis CBS 106.47]
MGDLAWANSAFERLVDKATVKRMDVSKRLHEMIQKQIPAAYYTDQVGRCINKAIRAFGGTARDVGIFRLIIRPNLVSYLIHLILHVIDEKKLFGPISGVIML